MHIKTPINAPKVLVVNGPNLDRLGKREPDIYGYESLVDVNKRLQRRAFIAGLNLECFQSNSECELIEKIHRAMDEAVKFLIINPAAYTHTSVALRDAVSLTRIPMIEVHISNPMKRESFRHFSYFSDIARSTISGMGTMGYDFALEYVIASLKNEKEL